MDIQRKHEAEADLGAGIELEALFLVLLEVALTFVLRPKLNLDAAKIFGVKIAKVGSLSTLMCCCI